jgi:hypothetical protein
MNHSLWEPNCAASKGKNLNCRLIDAPGLARRCHTLDGTATTERQAPAEPAVNVRSRVVFYVDLETQ